MKKTLGNLILLTGLAAASYNLVPPAYQKIRRPEIVRTEYTGNIEVRTVRTRSKTPILKQLDDLLLDRSFTNYTNLENGKPVSRVDLSSAEDLTEEILNMRKDCEAEKCNFREKLVCNILKRRGCNTLEECRNAIFDEIYRSTVEHEVSGHGKHPQFLTAPEHIRTSGRVRQRSEQIAFIKQFQAYPQITLVLLDRLQGIKSYNIYSKASEDVFIGLENYFPKEQLADKSPEELSELGKRIYR